MLKLIVVLNPYMLLPSPQKILTQCAPGSSLLSSSSDDLFDSDGHLTPRLANALSTALHNNPTTPALIATNLTSITIFHPSESHTYEPIHTANTPLALRALIAAYLLRSLPPNHAYLTYADASELYHEHIPRIGPPQNPSLPVQPDDDVFAQFQRHSDFDFVTLAHDRARALQFFRWQEHMRRSANEKGSGKIVVHPRDVLCASSARPNLISMTPGWDARPSYPYDEAQLPAETLAHLEAIQRPSPLAEVGELDVKLARSAVFEVVVDRVISEGSKWGLSTVYLCHLMSIDKEPVPTSSSTSLYPSPSSPQLCLKLYDDRFQRLCPAEPNDPLYRAADQPRWFDGVAVAEEVALCEARAYVKMRAVWGTVVPWFYGVHEVG
ncbi:hypothetical protein BDN70DRAFT_286777 [Pholiota conissans]|uniref:Uncharacterized protein n=1 Tax=Pholiota conissans TaxID=109636 RepID=A0A9P6CQD4_9AGAR|nr:hypothetical protein BDN70DRAFT_286777 [Pholiota conissans]